jgi:serine/threonine-protein phosphatase 2A activator
MLDDISGVKTWEKVNTGMIKMYRAEVLGKLPVVQHFLFGSILPTPPDLPPNPTPTSDEKSLLHFHAGHVHSTKGEGWGDCCGIPVPSAFGAKATADSSSQVLSGPGIRPVPFD